MGGFWTHMSCPALGWKGIGSATEGYLTLYIPIFMGKLIINHQIRSYPLFPHIYCLYQVWALNDVIERCPAHESSTRSLRYQRKVPIKQFRDDMQRISLGRRA